MQITTLGTSHGNPTTERFHSATLLEINDSSYLIDAGYPAANLLVRAGKEMAPLKAVFITHMHGDHVGGLPSVMTQYYKKKGDDSLSMDVFLPEQAALKHIEDTCRMFRLPDPVPGVNLQVYEARQVYQDDNITVTAESTRHLAALDGGPGSHSFLIEAEGKRIVFTGDLFKDYSDFPKLARDTETDICISEATHFKPESALPILLESPIKKLILNHVWDPWHGEQGEAALLGHFKDLPYEVVIAHDDDVFTV